MGVMSATSVSPCWSRARQVGGLHQL